MRAAVTFSDSVTWALSKALKERLQTWLWKLPTPSPLEVHCHASDPNLIRRGSLWEHFCSLHLICSIRERLCFGNNPQDSDFPKASFGRGYLTYRIYSAFLHKVSHVMLMIVQQPFKAGRVCLHFTEEETESQRCKLPAQELSATKW